MSRVTSTPDADTIRDHVRETYAAIASGSRTGCCEPSSGEARNGSGCCGGGMDREALARLMGYTQSQLDSLPDQGANLGLGCGNPTSIAALKPGQTVLDLGCGGGLDCFLAAEVVGPHGHVIGVDMTPEMLARARASVRAAGLDDRIEIRLGEIENLPVADQSVDVILSNCVVNLSPDKPRVFAESFRVLRPGGRLAIADVVAVAAIPPEARSLLTAISACTAQAMHVDRLKALLEDAGFVDVRIVVDHSRSRQLLEAWSPGDDLRNAIASANIFALRPVSAPDSP